MDKKNTVSTIFFIKPLRIEKEDLKKNGFINAYYKDKNNDNNCENCVFLLFKPPNWDVFEHFLESEYERTSLLIEDYDIKEGYVVLVYKLDEKWENDWNLVKKGKYSMTSSEFQEMFPKVVKIIKDGKHKDELSLQYRIFKKTPDMKEFWEDEIGVSFKEDMEVWPIFEEEKETLDIDKINDLV